MLALLPVFPLSLMAQQDPSAPLAPSSWLRVGAEGLFRGETERSLLADQKLPSTVTFLRLRLRAEIKALDWLRFTVQFQDARTLTGSASIIRDLQDHHADVQYAYAQLGANQETGWSIRAGRQPLAFGDERLVGADASWDNRAPTFDGIRTTLRKGAWQWDFFSAAPVQIMPTQLDPLGGPELFSGAYGHWAQDNVTVEPYVLQSHVRQFAEGAQQPLASDLWTPGVRIASKLPLGFDSITELVLQRGKVSSAPLSAWAGYWELDHKLGSRNPAPGILLSYSQASGGNLAARRIGTFNDMHPSGFNQCGFFEPFAWRNIRDLRAAANWSALRKWNLTAEFHSYWLASLHDGIYADEGPVVLFNASASSSRLGTRLLLGAQRNIGHHFDVAFGYAKFFRAEYLAQNMALCHSAFISWTARL